MKRKSSRMRSKESSSLTGATVTIMVALISLVSTVVIALFNFPPFQRLFEPVPTANATQTALSARTTTLTPTTTVTPTSTRRPSITITPLPNLTDPDILASEVARLRSDILQIQSRMEQIEKRPNVSSDAINSMKSDVENINSRLEPIEVIVSDNPAKALQLTALRIEIDALKSQIASLNTELASARDESQRASTLFFSILGLISALLFIMITFAINLRTKSVEEQADAAILRDKVESLDDQLEELEEGSSTESSNIAELRGQIHQMRAQIEGLEKQNTLEKLNIELREQVKLLNDQIDKLSHEKTEK